MHANTSRRILRTRGTEEETGYSRSSLYRLEKLGLFPPRVKLGTGQGGAVGWRADEVQALIDARAAGKADDEIRALVADLVARRTSAA